MDAISDWIWAWVLTVLKTLTSSIWPLNTNSEFPALSNLAPILTISLLAALPNTFGVGSEPVTVCDTPFTTMVTFVPS